jgi:ubiquinone/menaquinone biosynthesis C-methylase UbiE
VRSSLRLWLYERLYRELAWAYDPVSWLVSGGRWRQWQLAVLPDLAGETILDLGCGPGHLVVELLRRGKNAYGVDRSPAMQRLANRRLRRAGFPGRVVGADARALPFAAASVDSVVFTFPTPLVREADLWRELARVLRPTGRVVVVLGARAHHVAWWNVAGRWWRALGMRRSTESASADSPTEIGLPTRPLQARLVTREMASSTVCLVVAEWLDQKSELTDSF